MPCVPFLKLFRSWPKTGKLPVKQLQLKAMTLLALGFMARPSDWCPRGVLYDGALKQKAPIVLHRDQVEFRHDNLLCITFFRYRIILPILDLKSGTCQRRYIGR